MRRIPLEGTRNTRDLGGYPCPGGATRWGQFLRSDNPAQLTWQDLDTLKNYGLSTVVDLRRYDECERTPSQLDGAPHLDVHNISINNNFDIIDFEGDTPGTMAGLYITLLDDSRAEIAQVMQAMAEAEGCSLFHCAVGKDRTGVIAMLLLKLAGVDDADVIADYAITDIYMNEIFEAQSRVFRDNQLDDYVLRSRPASMERVLRHLHDTYKTAESYLLGCGLSPETVAKLKGKLVD